VRKWEMDNMLVKIMMMLEDIMAIEIWQHTINIVVIIHLLVEEGIILSDPYLQHLLISLEVV